MHSRKTNVKLEHFEIVKTRNDKVLFSTKNVWIARLLKRRGFGRRNYDPTKYHVQSVENGRVKRLLF